MGILFAVPTPRPIFKSEAEQTAVLPLSILLPVFNKQLSQFPPFHFILSSFLINLINVTDNKCYLIILSEDREDGEQDKI